MASTNIYEDRARARKVARLVAELDRTLRQGGLDPHSQAAGIAAILCDRWGPPQWASLAVGCGSRPPSDETRRQVVDTYRRRAGESERGAA